MLKISATNLINPPPLFAFLFLNNKSNWHLIYINENLMGVRLIMFDKMDKYIFLMNRNRRYQLKFSIIKVLDFR